MEFLPKIRIEEVKVYVLAAVNMKYSDNKRACRS